MKLPSDLGRPAPGKWVHSDSLGISASMICLVHCMAVPVAAAVAPLFLAQVLEAPWFHLTLILLVGPVAVWALWGGYLDHRHKRIVLAGALGLTLVAVGSLAPLLLARENPLLELGAMAVGSSVLILTHLQNYRLRLAAGHGDHCIDHCKGH